MPSFSVLVPLDGTQLSEQALSFLPLLHSLGATKVRLVSVWEDIGEAGTTGAWISEASQKGRAYLSAYLDSKLRSLSSLDLQIEGSVTVGHVVDEILRLAEEHKTDLLLMATHGRTGVQRWRLGSVADKIVRSAPCPTLVIGPNVRSLPSTASLRRILVPLDGSKLAERALPAAASLARQTGATLELIAVPNLPTLWTADRDSSVNVAQAVTMVTQEARRVVDGIELEGLTPKRTVLDFVTSAGVGAALAAYVETNPPDLVVMTSHGRHGVSRWALGSVTDELLRGRSPVLVLRSGSEPQEFL
jgi:nucleotide-binding universal stress UspA family protein